MTHDNDAPAAPYAVDRSGRRFLLDRARWRSDDGTPLMPAPMPGLTPDRITTTERSHWRYGAALPIAPEHRLSLGEGFTPMPTVDWNGVPIHMKLEWFNPTGSFKDRGVSVMLSHLVAQGATDVLEDSSGNGGSAVAAYAAFGGVPARILVPEHTSPTKILQVRAFGARIELVSGTRDEVADEAVRQSETSTYASHNWHPLFLAGTKTIGYEIWEMLGIRAPDNIVLVAGAGSIVLGCDLAFGELLAAGQIERRPRLLVGQPEQWATIADTTNGVALPEERQPTIAEGASIARPIRLPEAVAAIERSGGAAVGVTDGEIRAALRSATARGLYPEPTSAVAIAALDRFLAAGMIGAGQTTVVVLTGTGLKAAARMQQVWPDADK